MTAEKRSVVIDIAKGTALTYLFLLLPMLTPLFSVANVFVPAPAIFYFLKSGKWTGFAIVALSLFALMIPAAGSDQMTFYTLLVFMVIAISLPLLVAHKVGGGKSITITVAVTILVMVLAAVILRLTLGFDIQAEGAKAFKEMESATIEMYKQMGGQEDPKLTQAALRSMMDVMRSILPALMIIWLSSITAANLLAVKILSSNFTWSPGIKPFSIYRNPDYLIWFLIISGFGTLGPEPLSNIALNILVVLLFLYFLQGLAIVTHFFDRFKVGMFIRTLFYLLLLFPPYLAVAVLVLGIFDLWGNFRVPRNTENL